MSANPGDKREPNKKKEEHKSKASGTLDSLKKNENIESLMSYAKSHTLDTIAYIIMIIGLVWIFFNSFYGGILIGLVFGYYFSDEILERISDCNKLLQKQDFAKSLILAGTCLALFILAPGIVIGAAIVIGIKYLIKTQG